MRLAAFATVGQANPASASAEWPKGLAGCHLNPALCGARTRGLGSCDTPRHSSQKTRACWANSRIGGLSSTLIRCAPIPEGSRSSPNTIVILCRRTRVVAAPGRIDVFGQRLRLVAHRCGARLWRSVIGVSEFVFLENMPKCLRCQELIQFHMTQARMGFHRNIAVRRITASPLENAK